MASPQRFESLDNLGSSAEPITGITEEIPVADVIPLRPETAMAPGTQEIQQPISHFQKLAMDGLLRVASFHTVEVRPDEQMRIFFGPNNHSNKSSH